MLGPVHRLIAFFQKRRPKVDNSLAWLFLSLSVIAIAYIVVRSVVHVWDLGSERLYWEYAGRLNGQPYVAEFPQWKQFLIGEFPASWRDASTTERLSPYTDFVCEYPPGALIYFAALRAIGSPFLVFTSIHNALMALCILAMFWFALRTRKILYGDADPALATGLLLCFIYFVDFVLTARFDPLVGLLTSIALFCIATDRWRWAAVALGIGGAIKIWPAMIVPLAAVYLWRSRGFRHAVLVGVISFTSFITPHLAALLYGTAPADMFGYLGYMSSRPLQIESVAAAILATTAKLANMSLDVFIGHGSENIAVNGVREFPFHPLPYLATAYALMLYIVWRAAPSANRTNNPLKNTTVIAATGLATVAVTMIVSPVLSSEYYIWLAPFVFILTTRERFAPGAFYLAAIVSLQGLVFFWADFKAFEWHALLILNLKNGALIALVFAALFQLRGPLGQSGRTRPQTS